MTEQELQAEIEVLKDQEKKAYDVKDELTTERDLKITEVLKTYFKKVLDKGFEIEYSRERAGFNFKREDGYIQEGLILYLRSTSYKSYHIDKVDTSFYSTSSHLKSELRRMVVIGLVGEVLLNHENQLVNDVNDVFQSYVKKLEQFRTEINITSNQISELKSKIREIEQKQAFDQIESKEGMSFEVNREHPYRMPNIDIKYDWTITGIANIKLIDKTKSGKSGTLEIITYRKVYNYEEKKYEDAFNTETYEKVRMKNIEYFVNIYKDQMIQVTS